MQRPQRPALVYECRTVASPRLLTGAIAGRGDHGLIERARAVRALSSLSPHSELSTGNEEDLAIIAADRLTVRMGHDEESTELGEPEQASPREMSANEESNLLWPPDVATRLGDYLRQMRHLADLSQRELSAAAGVSNATVIRLEADPQADPRLSTLTRLVAAAGFRLLICGDEDEAISPQPELYEIFRDLSGRRLPAHLDAQTAPSNIYRLWWQPRRGEFTFTKDRDFRDKIRARKQAWFERYLRDRGEGASEA